MKTKDLLKVLGISFLVVVLLSWIIPAGIYSSGKFTSLGQTVPIGLYDIFRTPLLSLATFIQYGLLLLVIGGFYGVLNKTQVYSKLINNIVKKWNKKKNIFLIITIVLFALLTSLMGTLNLVFVLVPFFTAILLKLGYSKITAFASTVGSMLFGQIGCILGFDIWGYLTYFFDVNMTTMLAARIILFIIITVLLVLLINKKSKDDSKENEIPLYEENTSKKGVIPLIIISILTFVFLFIGLYNWESAFGIDIFTSLDETIMSSEIGGYPFLSNLLGTVSVIGSFNNYDLMCVLIISSLIIGWIYSVRVKDMLIGFKDGAKQMLLPALYALLSCTIFASVLNMSSGNFVITIIDKFISGSEKFSLLGTIGSGLVSSFAYNDFYYVLYNLYCVFSLYDASTIPIIALIFQTMYGIVMVIAPTSIFLLAGLSYLDIPYKEWAKYIWKFLLIILAVVVIVLFILTTLI